MHCRQIFALGGALFVLALSPSFGATQLEAYDTVAHALALGLSPEASDLATDHALASADACDGDDETKTICLAIQHEAKPLLSFDLTR